MAAGLGALALNALDNATGGAFGSVVAYLGPNSRSIGTIIPDVVIEEAHRDALVITQHPVEKGTAITDHAFATPATVVIRCGFSNCSAGDPGYARATYQEFLAWKRSRDPRDVYTGKRAYRNMLPADIAVHTDGRTENVLAITVLCQEVIIASTQTTGTGTDTTQGGANQADPANTGSVANGGAQQGSAVGAQDFAGSFSPGLTNPEGGTVGNGSFGLTDALGSGGSGISPPTLIGDVGPMTIQDGTTGEIIIDDSNGVNLGNAMNPGATGIFR